MNDLETALNLIETAGFATGPDWKAAHEIAQRHEGEPLYDALHALLHRIEGDVSNAAYWDRRAGTDFGGNGPQVECAALKARVTG